MQHWNAPRGVYWARASPRFGVPKHSPVWMGSALMFNRSWTPHQKVVRFNVPPNLQYFSPLGQAMLVCDSRPVLLAAFLVFAAAIAQLFSSSTTNMAAENKVQVGDIAPDVELTTSEGEKVCCCWLLLRDAFSFAESWAHNLFPI